MESVQVEASTSLLQKSTEKLANGSMQQVPYYDEKLYKRFLDGDLQNELDEATIAHGYGTLSTGESIGASGPKYTCASVANDKTTL